MKRITLVREPLESPSQRKPGFGRLLISLDSGDRQGWQELAQCRSNCRFRRNDGFQRFLKSVVSILALVPCLALAAKPAGEGVGAGSVLQLLFGMAIVIGAIFAVAFVLRRMNRFSNGTQGAIKVIGGVSLGTRERAVLVQVGEQQLLVGVAPGRVQTLHVLEQPLALPNASAPMLGSGENFAERLAKLMKGKGA